MADELSLDFLEQQQKNLEQKLKLEIQKREASHLKLQNQINGFKSNFHGTKSNFQHQMQGMNEKFDHINEVLASIQLQILNLQSRSQKFAPLPQNLTKPFSAQWKPTPEVITTPICVMKLPKNPESDHILHRNHERKIEDEGYVSHPIFHINHEKKMRDEGSVLIKNLIGTSKQELQYVAVIEHTHIGESNEVPDPTSVDVPTPKMHKSEELLDNPRDLVREFIVETPTPYQHLLELEPNSMSKLLGSDRWVQRETITSRRRCFVIDRGRRTYSKGGVKRTSMKLCGGLEEAWSRRLPKLMGRRKPCSRRATKERIYSFLAGFAATTKGKSKETRRRTCRPFSYEKNRNDGRDKARISRTPKSSGRSDAWSRRIARRWQKIGSRGFLVWSGRRPQLLGQLDFSAGLYQNLGWVANFVIKLGIIRGNGRAVNPGGRREAWCRRIAKSRESPAPDFEFQSNNFSSLTMDDSGEREVAVGFVFSFGPKSSGMVVSEAWLRQGDDRRRRSETRSTSDGGDDDRSFENERMLAGLLNVKLKLGWAAISLIIDMAFKKLRVGPCQFEVDLASWVICWRLRVYQFGKFKVWAGKLWIGPNHNWLWVLTICGGYRLISWVVQVLLIRFKECRVFQHMSLEDETLSRREYCHVPGYGVGRVYSLDTLCFGIGSFMLDSFYYV